MPVNNASMLALGRAKNVYLGYQQLSDIHLNVNSGVIPNTSLGNYYMMSSAGTAINGLTTVDKESTQEYYISRGPGEGTSLFDYWIHWSQISGAVCIITPTLTPSGYGSDYCNITFSSTTGDVVIRATWDEDQGYPRFNPVFYVDLTITVTEPM